MKKIISTVAAIAFMVLTSQVVLAATAKCTVMEITDNGLTIDCGDKPLHVQVGDVVKVKTIKKKAIEGC